MNAITLTDSPRVVQLKVEFRYLDALKERMKEQIPINTDTWTRLNQIHARQADIAREIFHSPNQIKTYEL